MLPRIIPTLVIGAAACALLVPAESVAVESAKAAEYRAGRNFIPTRIFSAEQDGEVLVVPRDVALEVAAFAHTIIEGDKAGRRRLYQKLGLPEDASIR